MVLTVAQRRAREAQRRRSAARAACAALSRHARRLGGRYVLYGSAARDAVREDSDLDLLLDFPTAVEAEAWRVAESVAVEHRLPLDVMPLSWVDPRFAENVLRDAVSLG